MIITQKARNVLMKAKINNLQLTDITEHESDESNVPYPLRVKHSLEADIPSSDYGK